MIDLEILVYLGIMTAAQTSGKIETEKEIHKLFDYCATHPNDALRYKDSRMALKLHGDYFFRNHKQGAEQWVYLHGRSK